jgi:hypothetical protein
MQSCSSETCLMTGGMQRRPEAYDALYERAEAFLAAHPDTYWCYGNHDMSYFWDAPESGMARGNVLRHVQERSRAFWDKVPQDRKAFVHRIDNVCFSHAGILQDFIEDEGPASASTDDALAAINQMGRDELWQEFSPLWARPQGMADLDILYRSPGALPGCRTYPGEVRSRRRKSPELRCLLHLFVGRPHRHRRVLARRHQELDLQDNQSWRAEIKKRACHLTGSRIVLAPRVGFEPTTH